METLIRILKSGGVLDFSSMDDGNMKVTDGEDASGNRKDFIRKNFPRNISFRMARVNHGTEVVLATRKGRQRIFDADAILTKEQGIAVGVTFADCPPILLFDRKRRMVGAIHGSYKTVLNNIISKTVLIAIKHKVFPEDLLAVIGPGICERCYEIGEEVLYHYEGYEKFIFRRDGRIFVDLKGIITEKLIEAQVGKDNIFSYPRCTCCERDVDGKPIYFSARRDKTRPPKIKAGLAAICREY